MTTTKKIILWIIIGLLIVSLWALYFWFKINDAQNNSLAKARDWERLADLKTIQIGYQSMLYDLKDFSEERRKHKNDGAKVVRMELQVGL